jgi:hypothetical protein
MKTPLISILCAFAFSTSALAAETPTISEAEQDYYSKVFDYTMDSVKPGESYSWESYSIRGALSPQKPFVSASKYHCRPYAETFMMGDKVGKNEGYACKRQGADGWCRLAKDAVLSCAMEQPVTVFNLQAPSINATIPSVGGGSTVDTPVSGSGSVQISMPSGPKVSAPKDGKDVANSVTGGAGSAATGFAEKAPGWFQAIFGR